MEGNQICILASELRRANPRNNNIFTISTTTFSYLTSTFDSLDEQSTSFHLRQPQNFKGELIKDLQYLYKYVQNTKTLKLYNDGGQVIDLSNCKNLVSVEFYKVDVGTVRGLQGLRPHIQKISCQKNKNNLEDILSKCGADESHPYCWNELKEAFFIGNCICEIDQKSLECVPWLHTIDLSHNEITSVEPFSVLHNLKHLNLSYNRLERVDGFKGQICSRLQYLILKNNFIEDITGLKTLTNLLVLDLSHNTLLTHKTLLPLTHLATLQWLNLHSNPLTYHPNHRTKTSCHLHSNTSSTGFILNDVPLTLNERRFVGSFHPLQSSLHDANKDSMTASMERSRRVREVVIEEEGTPRGSGVPSLSCTPQEYLETKRQIEDLHEKFGESWLNSASGLVEVLGLEVAPSGEGEVEPEVAEEVPEMATEVSEQDSGEEEGEDVEGEESIYLATVKGEEEPVFLVIGGTHFFERECSGGREREKWHIDSVGNCEIVDEVGKVVQVDFETMRKDRQRREYVFEEEMEEFVECMTDRIRKRVKKEVRVEVMYQCMKCGLTFSRSKDSVVLEDKEVFKCPACESTLIVEDG